MHFISDLKRYQPYSDIIKMQYSETLPEQKP